MKRGVTLVELLAALVISALVVTLASRIFLSGNREFLRRVAGSEELARQYRIKARLHHLFEGTVASCSDGAARLKSEGAVDSLFVKCLVVDTGGKALVPWDGSGQPQLVEYRVVIRGRYGPVRLEGSVLK
jgi:prepilin-type N-terminal cleavage/methylation domain-containing protein